MVRSGLVKAAVFLASNMIFGVGDAYDYYNHDKVDRSLDNIFQDDSQQRSDTHTPSEQDYSNHYSEEEQDEEDSIVVVDSAPTPKPTRRAKMKKAAATAGSTYVYTTDDEFNSGSPIGVNHDDVPDQLQLDSTPKPYHFIWVACSARGTVVKVDTRDGKILGEFNSAPTNGNIGDPSRTTVDQNGSVWVANRKDLGPDNRGTIVHIGLVENNQWENRNGDGIIQTSTGLGDIKPWIDASGTRGIQTAQDECIVHYTVVTSSGTRHLSIDKDNNVWVGGKDRKNFDKVKGGRYDYVDAEGSSGTVLKTFLSVGFGGYGGLIDGQGFLWSSRPLLRWDISKDLTPNMNGNPSGLSIGPLALGYNWAGQGLDVYYSYGLCIDSKGYVWNTDLFNNAIHKFAPDGTHIGEYHHGSENAQGCVVDLNDHVWIAHSERKNNLGETFKTVGHIANDGAFISTVTIGSGPTGVAVDRAGKVWVTNEFDDTLSRIDPSSNGGKGEVDLIPPVKLTKDPQTICTPYNYSDMTGRSNVVPPTTGTWTVMNDYGSVLASWGSIKWTAETPGDSSLTVQVRNKLEDPWKQVQNGQDLSGLTGQYLFVQVYFVQATGTSSSIGASPLLKDLTTRRQPCPLQSLVRNQL